MEERLPDGWVWTTIGEIAETTSGGTPLRSHSEYYGGIIPWVKSGELRDGIINTVEEFLSEEGLNNSSAKLFPKGVALVAMYGATVGRTGILGIDATTNQAVCAILPIKEAFLAKYITYWLQFQRQELIGRSVGGAQPNVNQEIIRSFPLPLAPLPEQDRIVAVIEQQFTRLDSGVASLHSAQAKTKQYRASLLRSAVEGELTQEWRGEHPASETGAELLKRILDERRARWEEEQLAKTRERGIAPKDDRWKKEYKEPQQPNVEQLPVLPEGWCYTFLQPLLSTYRKGMVTGPFGSLLKKHEHRTDGIPVFGIENIAAMRFVPGNKIYITQDKASELSQYDALPGDILISRSGTVGEVCVVPENLGEARISTNLMRVSLVRDGMLPQFFCLLFNGSPFVLEQVAELCKGSTRDFLSQAILSQIIFPLPPLAEQEQIVSEVEASLSNIAKLEEATENNLKRADHERQSILQEAFAGRLVDQDPNDEPASVLLERVREERKRREESEKVARVSRKGVVMGIEKRRRNKKSGTDQQKIDLYEKLVEVGQPLAADDLFQRVGLKTDEQPESVELFYEELHVDVKDGLIKVSDDASVLLEALEPSAEMLARMQEEEEEAPALQETAHNEKIVHRPTLWDM